MEIPSFPAYPINGGRIEAAPKKIGTWIYQPKIDDWHGVVHVPTGRVWNQYGQPSSIAEKFFAPLRLLQKSPFKWLDVGLMNNRHDMMRGCIVIFDVIAPGPFIERRTGLEKVFADRILPMASELLEHGSVHDQLFLINQTTEDEINPLPFWHRLQAENCNALLTKNFYEGVVAKRIDKPYPLQLRKPKEPTPWMMKHRFDR